MGLCDYMLVYNRHPILVIIYEKYGVDGDIFVSSI
jgi:hypothetical protein